MKKILLVLSILFLFSGKVYAECSGSEKIDLNQKVANIKVKYEIVTNTISGMEGSYVSKKIQVNIFNLSEEFYVVVTNKTSKEQKTYTVADAENGIITFDVENISKVNNYMFEVKALIEKTNCGGELIKIAYLTTPRTNEFHHKALCENEEFSYCQEFVTLKEIDEQEFQTKYYKYLEEKNGITDENGKNNESDNPIIAFVLTYKWYIIITLIVISIASAGVILVNNKKKRELGL